MGLILRNVKGRKLTHTELDNNFVFLLDLIVGASAPRRSLTPQDLVFQNINVTPIGRVPYQGSDLVVNVNLNLEVDEWVDEVFFDGFELLEGEGMADGASGVIKNTSSLPIRLIGDSKDVALPLGFASRSNFNLKPGVSVPVVYSAQEKKLNVLLSELEGVELRAKRESFFLDENQLEDDVILLSLSEVPSLSDFVNVFYDGRLITSSAVTVQGRDVIIDKKSAVVVFQEYVEFEVMYKY